MVVDFRAELRYTIRRARTRGSTCVPMTGCVFERTAGHVITETWTQTVCPAPAAVLLVGLGGWVRRCSCFADSESETERHRERERERERAPTLLVVSRGAGGARSTSRVELLVFRDRHGIL